MLHRIRRAMAAREALYTLGSIIEMDQAYFGRVDHGRVGRGTEKVKTVVAVEVTPKGHPLHVKIVIIVKDFAQPTLTEAVQRIVAEGSHVRTDGWSGFARLSEAGDRHEVIPNPPRLIGDCPFPGVRTLISNAKAWVLATFYGLGPRYMAAYFAEFCWRFDWRRYGPSLLPRWIKTCLWAPPAMAPVSTAA
jgi:transposase-like protein